MGRGGGLIPCFLFVTFDFFDSENYCFFFCVSRVNELIDVEMIEWIVIEIMQHPVEESNTKNVFSLLVFQQKRQRRKV